MEFFESLKIAPLRLDVETSQPSAQTCPPEVKSPAPKPERRILRSAGLRSPAERKGPMRLILILVYLVAAASFCEVRADDCASSPTQTEMNECADAGLKQTDAELNKTYRRSSNG